jgi:hypothetical protein
MHRVYVGVSLGLILARSLRRSAPAQNV